MYIVYRPKRHKWTVVVVVCTRGTMPVPSHDTEAALLAWLSKDCQGCVGLWSSMYILSSSSRKASLENAWNGSKFGATLHYPSTMHAPPPFAYTHYNIFLLCSIYCRASSNTYIKYKMCIWKYIVSECWFCLSWQIGTNNEWICWYKVKRRNDRYFYWVPIVECTTRSNHGYEYIASISVSAWLQLSVSQKYIT